MKLPNWTEEFCPDCGKEMPVEVLRSSGGYYIGQTCLIDGPWSRLSEQYYKTFEIALQALENETFTMRQHP